MQGIRQATKALCCSIGRRMARRRVRSRPGSQLPRHGSRGHYRRYRRRRPLQDGSRPGSDDGSTNARRWWTPQERGSQARTEDGSRTPVGAGHGRTHVGPVPAHARPTAARAGSPAHVPTRPESGERAARRSGCNVAPWPSRPQRISGMDARCGSTRQTHC